MAWHLDELTIRQYQAGSGDGPGAMSIEAHLAACEACRGVLAADRAWLDRSWSGVVQRLDPDRSGVVERCLRIAGIPDWLARLVSLSPALRSPFVVALLAVIAFAVIASNLEPTGRSFVVFLVSAPLIPVCSIAVSYASRLDTARELAAAAPFSSLRLLLIRSSVVLTLAIGILLLAWPMVPAPDRIGISTWLSPGLTLVLVTLALASRFEIGPSAAFVCSAWCLTIMTSNGALQGFQVMVVFPVLSAVAIGFIAFQRSRYSQVGFHR